MALNKIFAIILFGFGLFASYEGLFNGCQDAWPVVWRIGLGSLFILFAMLSSASSSYRHFDA